MNSAFGPDSLQWLIGHGYSILFLLLLLEGPAVTAIGAFAAALGYFDLWVVLSLSILGNLIPDAIFYILGFYGRKQLIDKYGHYLRIDKEKMERLGRLYCNHIGKAITAVKLIPGLATPGLIMAGILRLPIKQYIWWSLIVTIPSSGFYFILGYFCESAYEALSLYEYFGKYIVLGLSALLILIYFISKKFTIRLILEKFRF